IVRRCPSCTASTAAMRPLMVAEPMLRAPKPEIVSESNFAGDWAAAIPQSIKAAAVVYIREINLQVMKSFLADSSLMAARWEPNEILRLRICRLCGPGHREPVVIKYHVGF